MNSDALRSLLCRIADDFEPAAVQALRASNGEDIARLLSELESGSLREPPEGTHKFAELKDVLPLIPAILGILKFVLEWAREHTKRKKKEIDNAEFRARLQTVLMTTLVQAGIDSADAKARATAISDAHAIALRDLVSEE